jgi:hypothetical protein
MAEQSPLAKLLQERKAKEQALDDALEAKRKKSEEIAAAVPGHWERAETALRSAIDDANREFSAAESPSRFRFEAAAQPGAGNFALGLLRHSGDSGKDLSVSDIVAVLDGRLIARRQTHTGSVTGSVLKVFDMAKIGTEDWSALIVQIFRADVPG